MGLILTLMYVALIFLSVPDIFPALAPYRIQLALGVLAGVASIPAIPGRSAALLNLPWWLMTAFTGVLLASWLPHGWFGGVLKSLFEFLPAGLVFFLVAANGRSLRGLRLLRLALIAATLYMLSRGLWEYHISSEETPYVMVQRLEGFEGGFRRLQGRGVLGDPNDYAQYLLALLPLLFVGRKQRSWTPIRLAPVLIAALWLYGIYLTRSRGGLLGLAAVAGLAALERVTWIGAGLVSAIMLAVLLMLGFTGGREVGFGAGLDRVNVWSDGLGLFKSSPLWGSGFGSFPGLADRTAHNSFLLCAAELGLLGYFFWMGSLWVSIRYLGEVIRPSSGQAPDAELQRWAKAVRISLYAFLLTGFFLSRTYAPGLYLLLGLATAIAGIEAERRGLRQLPAPKSWAAWTLGLCVSSIALIYLLVRLRAV